MNFRLLPLIVLPFLASLLYFAPLASAATPASKCVTAATSATHANVLARMEKDIAPYAARTEAAASIKNYRDDMTLAWGAMNEPYCGYGSYGSASAIKSYTKSVNRARATFLADVKKLTKGTSTAAAAIPAATPTPKPAATSVPTPTPTATPKVAAAGVSSIPSGLEIGMRSANVTLLQKKLTAYFKLSQDSSNVTGYFGPKTEALVKRFQLEKGIISSNKSYGAGFVGRKTAAAMNAL